MATFTRRSFLSTTASVGAGALVLPRAARAQSASETIGVGLIGCGGRGGEHVRMLKGVPGVKIVALCDPDAARIASTAKTHELEDAKTYTDLRKLLEDADVDAVTIATCNHWHCLAGVWACEAGKDVYCEKPLSHRLWEGRQLIKAGQDHDRIVAVGTQQRSDPMQAEIKDFLHDQQALGKIQSVVIARFGVRPSIGKNAAPLNPPETVDYNLWLGPAQDEPIYRNALHYDWHWVWNTGDGECGNWGVHLLDDVMNVVVRDRAKLPSKVASGGGRVVWNDAGESPNFHVAYLEADNTPILFALSNLPATPGSPSALKFNNVECGYVVLCEGGEYRGVRGSGVAVDKQGKPIRQFKGDSGAGHMKNFFDAVRARDRKIMTAPVEIGHASAGWAHVINAAYRSAAKPGLVPPDAATKTAGFEPLDRLVAEHLKSHGLDKDAVFKTSGLLEIDVEGEKFVGAGAEQANVFLDKPNYRGDFAIRSNA